jgi:hypothetical protein
VPMLTKHVHVPQLIYLMLKERDIKMH